MLNKHASPEVEASSQIIVCGRDEPAKATAVNKNDGGAGGHGLQCSAGCGEYDVSFGTSLLDVINRLPDAVSVSLKFQTCLPTRFGDDCFRTAVLDQRERAQRFGGKGVWALLKATKIYGVM